MTATTPILGAITGRANEAQELADVLGRDHPAHARARTLARQLRELALRAGDADPEVAHAQRVLGFRDDRT